MVDCLDEFNKSSQSVYGKDFPHFEKLDAKIASALIRSSTIPTSRRRSSIEEQKAQKGRSVLRGGQIAFMIHDYFQVTGAHDTVLGYADLLSVILHDDNVQEFDT